MKTPVVLKYEVPFKGGVLSIPSDAQFAHFALQKGVPHVWFFMDHQCDVDDVNDCYFRVFATGEPFPIPNNYDEDDDSTDEWEHLGTIIENDFVFHLGMIDNYSGEGFRTDSDEEESA